MNLHENTQTGIEMGEATKDSNFRISGRFIDSGEYRSKFFFFMEQMLIYCVSRRRHKLVLCFSFCRVEGRGLGI